MINSIIQGISIALNNEFGDNYEIHTEELRQGLKEPCFFVSCINPTNELFLNRRYYRKNQFAVQYFPFNVLQNKRECNDIAERLYLCLEWITADNNLTMGTQMHAEIVDGILNFFVNYDMFVYKVVENVPMEELHLTQKYKKE